MEVRQCPKEISPKWGNIKGKGLHNFTLVNN